jgi:hypothetical protein
MSSSRRQVDVSLRFLETRIADTASEETAVVSAEVGGADGGSSNGRMSFHAPVEPPTCVVAAQNDRLQRIMEAYMTQVDKEMAGHVVPRSGPLRSKRWRRLAQQSTETAKLFGETVQIQHKISSVADAVIAVEQKKASSSFFIGTTGRTAAFVNSFRAPPRSFIDHRSLRHKIHLDKHNDAQAVGLFFGNLASDVLSISSAEVQRERDEKEEDDDDITSDASSEIIEKALAQIYVVPKRELRLLARNKREIAMIQQIISGEIDVTTRFESQRKHYQEVRSRNIEQQAAHVQSIKQSSEMAAQIRGVKKERVENVEGYILRICSWMVTIRMAQSGLVFQNLMNDDVRHAGARKQAWAGAVLARSIPVLFRKFMRRRRLRTFGAAARIMIFLVRHRKRHISRAIVIIHSFLFKMKADSLLKVKSFLSKVRMATRISRAYFVVRMYQFKLLQRQWDAMETVLLLTEPELGVGKSELSSTDGVASYNEGSSYDAIPASIRAFKHEVYHLFLGRWKRHCKTERLSNSSNHLLPKSLEAVRTYPQIRDNVLREYFVARNKKQLRMVNQLYLRYMSEKRSAKDMLEASIRLRHLTALDDVRALYPTIARGTRMFDLLVQYEEEFSASPFFEVMMANNRAVIFSQMPAVPHSRMLLKGHELAKMVRRGLEQSRLTRILQRTGASAGQAVKAAM